MERVLKSHAWEKKSKSSRRHTSPHPKNAIQEMYETTGPSEETKEHQQLVDDFHFSFRSLLGELMYAYVTCRPDIGYAVTTLSKFASHPARCHFRFLKHVALYLKATKSWGIHYHRSSVCMDLPTCPFDTLSAEKSLPDFPDMESGPTITGFLDAAHANDPRKCRSTTGYAFMMSGGCISYRSKTQPLTATSSTEAEFYAAVTAAKHARYLRAISLDLHRRGLLFCIVTMNLP